MKKHNSEVFRDTRTASEGFLYDLEATLKHIHGEGLLHLFQRGKLSLLAALGAFEKTNDPLLTVQMRTASGTRFCLLKIADEMDQIALHIGSTTRHIGKVISLLQQFRELCDDSINDQFSEGPHAKANAEGDAVFGGYMSKLQTATEELQEMMRMNCTALIQAGRQQIDEVYTAVFRDVGRTQTEYDTERRRRQVSERELQGFRGKLDIQSRNAARSVELDIERRAERLQMAHSNYVETVEQSKTNLLYALEQSSMSTWSAYNVLFSQLSTFFTEAAAGSEKVATAAAKLKTSQMVSQQIIAEKRAKQAEEAKRAKLQKGPSCECSLRSIPQLPCERSLESNSTASTPARHGNDLLGVPLQYCTNQLQSNNIPAQYAPMDRAGSLPPITHNSQLAERPVDDLLSFMEERAHGPAASGVQSLPGTEPNTSKINIDDLFI